MKYIHSAKYNFIWFVLALAFLGTFYPFVHNYVLFGNFKVYVTIAALVIWTISVIVRNKSRLLLPNKHFNIIIFIQASFFIVWSLIIASRGIMFYGINTLIGWLTILLIINSLKFDFFIRSFIKINIISLILSIIGLVLVVLGISGLYSVHSYQGEMQIYNYLFFFMKRTNITDLNYRVSGYYDEPGSFAFIVMFLLLINRKYFKNMKWEYSLLILPLVTTSLAHIITIFLFSATYYFNKRYLANIFYVLIIFIIIIYTLSKLEHNAYINYFSNRTIQRVENIISGEKDAGRDSGFEQGPLILKNHKWGISPEKIKELYPSYTHEVGWSPILYFGIIGYPFYLLPFIYILKISIKNSDKNAIYALIILLANLIQRPNYTYPIFIVLLYFLFFNKEKTYKALHYH